jgi:hypothetical protein
MSFILLGILNSQTTAGGLANDFDLLETVSITNSSTTSVTFSGLGSYSAYKHLQIRCAGSFSSGNASRWLLMSFNGDTSSNYTYHYLQVEGSSGAAQTFREVNRSRIPALELMAQPRTSQFNSGVIDILDFASSSKTTTTKSLYGIQDINDPYWRLGMWSGLWNNTAAVTSIGLAADNSAAFVSGSRFSLYGIKG